jgi:predicted Zn-dependent peptidase
MLCGAIQSPEDVVERIEAVTPDDLDRVVKVLLRKEHLAMAVVGPHRSEKRFLPMLDV